MSASRAHSLSVDVIGCGFSGLVTAFYLSERGAKVRVFEKGARAGGLIQTHKTPYGLVETAANALLNSEAVEHLFETIELPLVGTLRDARARYIFRGRPRRWPLSVDGSVRFAAALPSIMRKSEKARPREYETIHDWGCRVLGEEAARYFLAPALQGIYAGDPARMSASLILNRFFTKRPRGKKLKFRGSVSAPEGMGQLLSRLQEYLAEQGVEFHFSSERRARDADRPTVFCGSAHAASSWLREVSPKTADTLAAIDLLPVTTITCFFEPSPSDLKGFGVLYCRGEGVEALGTLLNAHIFEGRTSVRSETWIYGSTRATLETVLADRSKLVSSPAKLLDHRVQAWPEAIPHYTLELERALKNGLELPPNVFLNGNYLGDIGLSRILERARELAARILPEPALTQGKVVWQ